MIVPPISNLDDRREFCKASAEACVLVIRDRAANYDDAKKGLQLLVEGMEAMLKLVYGLKQ